MRTSSWDFEMAIHIGDNFPISLFLMVRDSGNAYCVSLHDAEIYSAFIEIPYFSLLVYSEE